MIEIAPETIPEASSGPVIIRVLRHVHDRIWTNFRFLKSQLILEGVRITGVPTTAGVPIALAHKLGRVPVGYWVTRSVGATAIRVTELASTPPTTTTITLTPSAAGTVDLYVY